MKSEAVGLGAAVSDSRTSVMKAAQLFALGRARYALRSGGARRWAGASQEEARVTPCAIDERSEEVGGHERNPLALPRGFGGLPPQAAHVATA